MKFIYVFSKLTYTTAILHFLRSFFIVMNTDLEIFVKTRVLLQFYNETRSSHQRCSIKAVLENFAIFTRKDLCWSLFLVKLQAFSPAILLKRDSNIGVASSSFEYCKIFKNNSFEEHLRMAVSDETLIIIRHKNEKVNSFQNKYLSTTKL